MKVKLLIFLGLALVGIHGMSAPVDVPAMDGWPFRLNGEMFQEYKAYICDSALLYLGRNLRWVQRHGEQEAADETRIRRAHLMSSAGMYKEASEDLEQINLSILSSRLLPDYYEDYRHLYGELGCIRKILSDVVAIMICLPVMKIH